MAFPKIDGYVVTEKLGSGSYSTVYKAHTKVGARSVVAIKCVDKSRVKHSGSAIENLITEIRLLKTLSHPHIVLMKDFTWDDKNIFIIMEYCCRGDLSKYIHRYGRVPEQQVLYFLQQLASALKFMREKGVVHMDLKPHNLLLHKSSDGKYTLKVADFGFAQYMSEDSAHCIRGSPLYMAPEMVAGAPCDARVDLWSVGVIMYECLFGKAPYSSSTLKELMTKIHNKAPIEIPPHSSISPGCQDLLTRLLQHDPNKRITYEEFFAHEYLDLEHMPSKENYDKAVSLIRRAVELDSRGAARDAFPLYCAALRYLVPAAAAQTDKMRKCALTAKLTSYMERAEEIKQQMRGVTNVDNTIATENCYENQPSNPQCIACTSSNSKQECEHVNRIVDEKPVENNETAPENPEMCNKSKSTTDRSQSRFTLKRLFSRQAVPLLDAKDTAASEPETDNKMAVGETDDGCKIT